ncbi:MAG: DUF2878 domain-containing protein [Marinicella sp.]
MTNWVSLLLLNVLWFASVMGAANQIIWPSAICLLALMMVLLIQQTLTKTDFKIIVLSLVLGWFIDGYLSYSGLIEYQEVLQTPEVMPPIWILFLWVGFGATITKGMQWMFNNHLLGALFIVIGAPLSYYSAERLGAVEINNYLTAMPFIAISWLIYFFILIQMTAYRKVSNDTVVQ